MESICMHNLQCSHLEKISCIKQRCMQRFHRGKWTLLIKVHCCLRIKWIFRRIWISKQNKELSKRWLGFAWFWNRKWPHFASIPNIRGFSERRYPVKRTSRPMSISSAHSCCLLYVKAIVPNRFPRSGPARRSSSKWGKTNLKLMLKTAFLRLVLL